MPRRKNKLPSYRFHKGSGQAVVTLSGKDFYLGVHGTEESHAEYKRVIAEWLQHNKVAPAESRTGLNPGSEIMDINELIVAYWQFAEQYYTTNGKTSGELINMQHAAKPLAELFGSLPTQDFRPASLKAVRQQMIDAGLSRGTINGRVNRIRRIFKWGVESDHVEPSVYHALKAMEPLRRGRCGAKEGSGVKPVPEDVVEKTLICMPPMLQAMVQVQLYTGMRPGELVMMRRRDIDTSGKVWLYKPESHKTQHHGHDRTIYIGAKAQEYLSPYLGTDLDAIVFNPRKGMKERWAVCKTHRHNPNEPRKTTRKITNCYTTSTYLQAVYHACDNAFPPSEPLCRVVARDGKRETIKTWNARLTTEQHAELKAWRKVHRWHPNQLRHNAGTYLRKEFGIEAARVVLGHTSAGTTAIYAEIDGAKAKEIMGRVG